MRRDEWNGRHYNNHPNLHLINTNAYTQFDRNPKINSQDIGHKQNPDVDQGL